MEREGGNKNLLHVLVQGGTVPKHTVNQGVPQPGHHKTEQRLGGNGLWWLLDVDSSGTWEKHLAFGFPLCLPGSSIPVLNTSPACK